MSTPIPTFDAPLVVGAQIEARANHPEVANRVFLRHGDRNWTFLRYRDESVRLAHFLLRRLGRTDETRPGHVAMMLDNHFELLSLFGGCAYGGLTLFGINTGLRGETLAGVLNHSRARILVIDERYLPELQRIQTSLKHIAPENILVLRTQGGEVDAANDFEARVTDEVAKPGASLDAPLVQVELADNLMVIYTSGTTGLPKGINNNHFKLCATGIAVSQRLGITPDDMGYACMPLFHSNAMFIAFMPSLWACGGLGIRERFSASGFLPDILKYGVTFWNYVGEPVHYVLSSIEKQFEGDAARIEAEVTNNTQNKMRYAVGNGAAPPDIDQFERWFGLEDIFELYGSTEAAISTFRVKGDPRGSVGEIQDEAVKILDERGGECPPATLDTEGKIANYEEAVGEICRKAEDTGLFQGYFDNDEANTSKYRDGVYHSGDLGHVLERDGKRYLFFDGRTDDWIRKDGENFSALQVARLLQEYPDIDLAAAYGAPCAVSDELVMVAVRIREGAEFDPQDFFKYCDNQVSSGSMDKKWFPDFVRLVSEFEFTGTQKILVRNLKQVHFDLNRLKDEPIFWRERGDTSYKPLTQEDYAQLRAEFEKAEKLDVLDR